MTNTISSIGAFVLHGVAGLGSYFIFLQQALVEVAKKPVRFYPILHQLEFVGNKSLLIILITGFFVGAVFALQVGSIFSIFAAESVAGGATAVSLAWELSPLITAFLITGRVGSAITAEIAAMKINEQIDALEAMGVNPLSYLVKPRIIASTIMVPVLSIFFTIVGIIGSYVSSTYIFGVSQGIFLEKLHEFLLIEDIYTGLVKAVSFGLLITSVACNFGLRARGGARGIGEATTNGVVANLLGVLCLDVIITYIQVST